MSERRSTRSASPRLLPRRAKESAGWLSSRVGRVNHESHFAWSLLELTRRDRGGRTPVGVRPRGTIGTTLVARGTSANFKDESIDADGVMDRQIESACSWFEEEKDEKTGATAGAGQRVLLCDQCRAVLRCLLRLLPATLIHEAAVSTWQAGAFIDREGRLAKTRVDVLRVNVK